MSDPFVHLRVASGYSLQYGASHPSTLVQQAADLEMDTLAITDRDGLYGAVRFAKACLRTGVAPVVGIDLAVPATTTARPVRQRTPVRGGEERDPRLPRVVVLATSKAGWAALCRLTSATHLAGERGRPVADPETIARFAGAGDLVVMLGIDSQVGRHLAAGQDAAADQELARWCALVGRENVVVAACAHDVGGDGPGSVRLAGRLVALADHRSVTAVLTNDVRMTDRLDAPTVDVLDAARRLVPLDVRNIDRRTAEGYLKPGKAMLQVAQEIAAAAGRGERGAERLLGQTRALALRCRLDPKADIGLGEIHLPEFGTDAESALSVLRQRTQAGLNRRYGTPSQEALERLDTELGIVARMGFAAYFLTVADVTDMIRDMGIRCAARGSGAGSLINYALGISGVDPLAYGLLMERFLSPLRQALPDIDIDVESARRTEIYRAILDRFGGERVACVAMLDTYRVRHAVRDVGAALSLPPNEIDAMAKAFPHIRARDARSALRDLPELRAAGLGERRLDVLFSLVESLDGLPRHVAVHPCGVLLSDATLLDRTPVEASAEGFPMSQFDKDDVEDMGLLKLDVLGIRMQSSMAHAVGEVERVTGERIDLDSLAPFDDPAVYAMIGESATIGCFQIESPGQRELVGKFGPSTFNDIVIDISLFRPGPVKTDMVVPFLEARNGWKPARFLHPSLRDALGETFGVMVFHEQVIKTVAAVTGCTLAQGDEARRALGDPVGQDEVKRWLYPLARERGYDEDVIDQIWAVLAGFASFGFCKAHAAAFALPTYQSAWLKHYYPAAFLAGVLTHDPGMYPRRLMLEEARLCGVTVLGLDINASADTYRICRNEAGLAGPEPVRGHPDGRGWGIRLPLSDVDGIGADEVERTLAGQPYAGLTDWWERATPSHPTAEKLIVAGAFDALYGIGQAAVVERHGRVTRRDLLLTLADLQRLRLADQRARGRARGLRPLAVRSVSSDDPRDRARGQVSPRSEGVGGRRDPVAVQLALDFSAPAEAIEPAPAEVVASSAPGQEAMALPASGPEPDVSQAMVATDVVASGLPEMDEAERVQAELAILGLDVSGHVIEPYLPLLRALEVTFSRDLLQRRFRSELLVAGVKVATQTPPVRSGRRVIFLTLDDTTGLADATFFEDAQGPYAATVFNSWLLLVRGELHRTGPKGVSLTATGAWNLAELQSIWDTTLRETGDEDAALHAVRAVIARIPEGFMGVGEVSYAWDWKPGAGRSGGHAAEQTETGADTAAGNRQPGKNRPEADAQQHGRGGGMGRRRVLVHASGFEMSPYADIKPAGPDVKQGPGSAAGVSADAPRKLWHSSPGSSGR